MNDATTTETEAETMTMEATIIKIEARYVDEYDIGYRYIESAVSIGDELPVSYIWDGDEMTDEELPGTCTFETFEQVADYAKYSAGSIAMVYGEKICNGDLAGEQIIADATVSHIWTRTEKSSDWI